MKTILTKIVLERKLYWTGTEWHPSELRALKYDTVADAWHALHSLLAAEGYGVEESL